MTYKRLLIAAMLLLILSTVLILAQDSSKVTLSVGKLRERITQNRNRMGAIQKEIADLQKEYTQREGLDAGLILAGGDSTLFVLPEKKVKAEVKK